jgi:hypothetical protein
MGFEENLKNPTNILYRYGESIAPYVKLFFGDPNNPVITVGNKSSEPFEHNAIIESFEYGKTDGNIVHAEIIDTSNGPFTKFVDTLSKCISKSKDDFKCGVQWGWITQDCTGKIDKKSSPIIYLLLTNISVALAEGKIKYELTFTDLMQYVAGSRVERILGTETKPKTLKKAITELCNDYHPKFDVKFVQIDKDGNEQPLKWDIGDEEGPESVWPTEGLNKLSILQTWIEPFITKDEKGAIILWDDKSGPNNPRIIILEDPIPSCEDSINVEINSHYILGKFIVNGGKKSNVISFNPSMNWASAIGNVLSGGGAVGGSTTGATISNNKKECGVQSKEAGSTLWSSPPLHATYVYSRNAQALDKFVKAQRKNRKANRLVDVKGQPISAELVIQGDPNPDFINSIRWMGRYLSILVINPFQLRINSGTNGCGDWLAQPLQNQLFSNRKWLIQGVNHSIREGSYTTTFKVQLAVPGIDLPAGQALGGATSLGYVPKNTC